MARCSRYGRHTVFAGAFFRQATTGVNTGRAAPMSSATLLPPVFAIHTLPEASIPKPSGPAKPAPAGAKLPARPPLEVNSVTLSPPKFVTQTWFAESIAMLIDSSRLEPAGEKLRPVQAAVEQPASNSATRVAEFVRYPEISGGIDRYSTRIVEGCALGKKVAAEIAAGG